MKYTPYQKREVEFFNGLRRKVQFFPSGRVSWITRIDGVFVNISGEMIDNKFIPFEQKHVDYIQNNYKYQREPINVSTKTEYYKEIQRRIRNKYDDFDKTVMTPDGVRKASYCGRISYKGKALKTIPDHLNKKFIFKEPS